jgi:hypothetical protein
MSEMDRSITAILHEIAETSSEDTPSGRSIKAFDLAVSKDGEALDLWRQELRSAAAQAARRWTNRSRYRAYKEQRERARLEGETQ